MMMENPRVMNTMNGVQVSVDEDAEISIFDAKKYFDESNSDSRVCRGVSPLDTPNPVHISSEHGAVGAISALAFTGGFSSAADGYGYGRTFRVRSFHSTPTPSSEASWNSQAGLLSNPTGASAIAVSMTTTDDKRKGSGKKRWLWRPCCPCSGKKSVQVEPKKPLSLNQKLEVDDQERQEIPVIPLTNNSHSISGENHEFHSNLGQLVVATTARAPLMMRNGSGNSGFSFPVLNQQPKASHVKMEMNRNYSSLVVDHEDPARESLDVFLPPDESSLSNSVPKKQVSRITIADDDVASDTSSDLFEIESLSTTTTQGQTATTHPMYNRRDSLDEALHFNTIRSISAAYNGALGFGCPYSLMVTGGYEPSEASIEWSVTTAEGLERGSVGVSEVEEVHSIRNGGKKKSCEGGLLSCRSQKAVSVGPNPVKYVPATTPKHVAVGNANNPRLSRLSLPFPV